MHGDLWLAQSETERKLRMALAISATVVAVWALLAAGLFWNSRRSLAAVQETLRARTQQLSDTARALPDRRAEAKKAARVKTTSPTGAGSGEFVGEITAVAQATGAEVIGVQIGDGDPAASAARPRVVSVTPGPQSPGGVQPVAAPQAGGTSGGDWSQETFECNVKGSYHTLSLFLNGLTASPRVLEFRAIQVMPAEGRQGEGSRLQLKLTGILYGLPDAP